MKKHHSPLKVTPATWEKNIKANLKKTWEVYYKFYNHEHQLGYTVRFKGMNRCQTIEEKQEMTRFLINNELRNLSNGYNPITKEYETEENQVYEKTPFILALQIALKKVRVADSTRRTMEDPVKLMIEASQKTGVSVLTISEVRKRDVRLMLDYLLEKGYSNDRYNRIKANLGILYNYFVDLEIFEHNYIRDIAKLPHTPKIRKIFRDSDKSKFEELKVLNYDLWRFLKLFYYSQSRISEFRTLKLSDIHFDKQYFVIFEKKGRRYHKVVKPINIHIASLWKEVLSEAKPGDEYVFTNKLAPGLKPCTRNSIAQKYKLWVKNKLGIKVDMYALKHTFANDVTKQYGIHEAQMALGHTNQRTTELYAVDYREDLLEKQKHLKTGF
ncbi:tyrosine-type recombinase/integrase [Chryseobacterium wangxinyae]|uniref:tyrosine-type recombinase/integrase n=1 Tax=Chryseobacterium sp. CY353 TaxID=2997334 RepID=UPI002271CF21|nr:tyrosine-type recombinase/integrase [Chryseobacterium sp. CY353]MCY0967911.1 tyrosine-type recombinase/integrase [Chryseobacterium sp. CY353]